MDSFVRRLSKHDSDNESSGTTSQYDSTTEHSQKRRRIDVVKNSESEDSEEPGNERGESNGFLSSTAAEHTTDFENALPPTQTDEGAIEEYEQFKSSQVTAEEEEPPEKPNALWFKNRSSIYVDAFNLALDTVLEEEAKLFNGKELEVFQRWKQLSYDSQYLYVRLFLRKTAAWHRTSRLGYYSDICDPEVAVEALQAATDLPKAQESDPAEVLPEFDLGKYELGETFTFADSSEEHITTVAEAAPLLYLDELKALAKDAKIKGRNKAELVQGLVQMSQQQVGLMSMGLSRQNSRNSDSSASRDGTPGEAKELKVRREDSNSEKLFLKKIRDVLGPCIRLSPLTFQLFERVHLVFYRSTEWTEKSLTTMILAKIARRNFPEYIVCRTSTIFASRLHLLEFEAAIRLEAEVDNILEFNGPLTEQGSQTIIDIFEQVYPRWQVYVQEEGEKERRLYEMGEGAYLRRFNPAHSYTRIIGKGIYVLGRRKEYTREHKLLSELLDQKLFHLSRRGGWYQRKALLEEHYMAKQECGQATSDLEVKKRAWNRKAAQTCELALQDPDCHLIHHYDLQKRLIKLEKKLRIPMRLQHDFGHVRLAEPLEITVEGVQLKKAIPVKPGALAASTKTIWLDELDTGGECSVEEMCLSKFRSDGWKGYHAEGGAIRTLFAYLFYDILFLYIPNVFQTAYQTCPLDLHTDAFFPARGSEINHRLVEIANGGAERLLRDVWEQQHEKRTSVVGLNWDYEVEDLAELVRCFEGSALAAVCKVMAQEYKSRGGGAPDLILWRPGDAGRDDGAAPNAPPGEVMFAEVKSANDRLSDTQRLWIHVLTGAGVKVALCHAVAREVRQVD